MRINEHQLGFFLGKVSEVMCFTYSPLNHKLHIYINVPTTAFGKPIFLEWCLERLSTVMKRTSMEVCVYDYLQRERQLVCLFPIQLQPSVLGYTLTNQKVRLTLGKILFLFFSLYRFVGISTSKS
jgi:hypothetical protein